jgi:L-glyceraldehyde 3-phosphate reductase
VEYRRLGRSGLKLSAVSLGSWLTYGTAVEMEQARACIDRAYELGVNHFDCAVAYGSRPHEAEEILGQILQKFPRNTYTVTSKMYWKVGPSTYDQGLSRKTLVERVERSLKALGLEYIDIYYGHRFDPETDLEETLRAFDDLVAHGKILYWGVSEWTAAQIEQMMAIVDRRSLHRPVVDQPGYNMLRRDVEKEIIPMAAREGLGIVAFSPLAQGLLTGKYRAGHGAPPGSRAAHAQAGRFLHALLQDEPLLRRVEKLHGVAERHGLSMSQLAIAWVLRLPEVTSALIGATRPEQVEENIRAVGTRLPDEAIQEIEEILR